MGSIDNVYIYKCDTCLRQVERLSDGKHPDPVRCVITNRCSGLLSLIGTRTGKPKLTPHIVGLDDRITRGTTADTTVKTPALPSEALATFIGGGGLAITGIRRIELPSPTVDYVATDDANADFIIEVGPKSSPLPLTAKLTAVLYEVSPSVLDYRHYMFSYSGVAAVIQGQDDTPERNLLRFGTTDSLRVYINGVELSETQYDRSVDDQVTLDTPVYGSLTIIDVYVYQDIVISFDENTAIKLDFLGLGTSTEMAVRNQCSWGDAALVTGHDGVDRVPLLCASLAELDMDKSYGIQRFEATSAGSVTKTLAPASITLLLASSPYSFNDKHLFNYVAGTEFTSNGAVISFKNNEASGVIEPNIDQTYVTSIFEPMVIKTTLTSSALTNPGATLTTSQTKTLIAPKKYIIGPS